MGWEFPKNYWYPVLQSNLLAGKPLKLKRFSKDLVFFRDSTGKPICLLDRCPHRGTSLSLGKVVGDQIECPMHGFRFDSTGRCKLIPANGEESTPPVGFGIPRYEVQEKHGLIWFWWGELSSTLPLIPWFEELETRYPYIAWNSRMNSPISFFRTMEGNLDILHFPFVHPPSKLEQLLGKWFPRKFEYVNIGPLVDPFKCEVSKDLIHLTWDLKKNRSETKSSAPLQLWLKFPNQLMVDVSLWKACGYFGAAPIDDERTYFVAAYSQGFCRIPILGKLVAWWLLNKVVLGPITDQDLRLQVSQRPKDIGLGADQLVAYGDRGIAEYFKMVKASQRQAIEKTGPTVTERRTTESHSLPPSFLEGAN